MTPLACIDGEWSAGTLDLNEDYDLVYSVCYYLDRNHVFNIKRHLDQIELLRKEGLNVLPIFVCCTNNLEEEHVEPGLIKLLCAFDKYINVTVQLSFLFNWGGTIAALWHTWKEFVEKLGQSEVVTVHFEEDFHAKNLSWVYAADRKLIHNISYVGDFVQSQQTTSVAEYKKTTARKRSRIKVHEEEVWTDGGYYYSTKSRLAEMERVVGIFHKGDTSTRYNHQVDGIDYGEVGFPTSLWHAGLRFTSLLRDDYFETT